MYHFRRNKSELIVLTGAIYAFVAYLTAFALEILFLIDLSRHRDDAPSASSVAPVSSSAQIIGPGQAGVSNVSADEEQPADDFHQFALDSIRGHITISCLTISILYFVIFLTSIILIVALILRSTFTLLIWTCAMSIMYLPELCLAAYVSVCSWGLSTRNGQTELAFYLIRAALNLIFIFRAHKLFKQWNYEKNFFRLKSYSAGGFPSNFSSPYDSPYFISGSLTAAYSGGGGGGGGDSLTTTINPIYSTSTLNLNKYDFVRDQFSYQADR